MTRVRSLRLLYYTRQLRDYTAYAQQNGYRFDLYVRTSTRLSGPLQQAVAARVITIRYLR
jgi:hypothetical protein